MSAIALGLTLALAAAACGDSDDTSSSGAETSTTEHNDTDVAFASDMLQHHTHVLAVVDLTQGRDLDSRFSSWPTTSGPLRPPEIETFTGWLTDWDEAVPATSTSGSMRDRDMPRMGGSMPGRDGMRGDAMRRDGMRGDAMRRDAMRGDAMRGDAMRGMMSGADMPGMSGTEMTALAQAPDAEFEEWLEMMIEHHTGAIDMSETETEQGQYKPAIDLANEVAESQTAEVETMENLLAS